MSLRHLVPAWPAPANVCAASTGRAGGVSEGPWRALNLATHVGDRPQAVAANRERLAAELALPESPRWLTQVHGTQVLAADDWTPGARADALVCRAPGQVAVVMSADCLPVLLCSDDGTVVAAAHAGWRGLAAGVLEATLAAMAVPAASLLAWLGPAIGPAAFEVGSEVRAAFIDAAPSAAAAFRAGRDDRWHADLYALARLRLRAAGVQRIHGGGWCTHAEPRFFSHRRAAPTGRQASLIWRRA